MSAAWPICFSLGVSTTKGTAGGGGVGHQLGEGGLADGALADVLVPVPGGAAQILRVVGVDQPQPVRADRGHQRVQGRRHAALGRQVVTGRPGVAGVEADPEHGVPVHRLEVGPELLHPGGQ